MDIGTSGKCYLNLIIRIPLLKNMLTEVSGITVAHCWLMDAFLAEWMVVVSTGMVSVIGEC